MMNRRNFLVLPLAAQMDRIADRLGLVDPASIQISPPAPGGGKLAPLAPAKIDGSGQRSRFTARSRGCLYRGVGPIDRLTLTDGILDQCGVLVRIDNQRVNNLTIERIRQSVKYFGGVGAGILHLGNATGGTITLRDFDLTGVDPITSPGDIYAAVTLAGNRAPAGTLAKGFLFERFRIANLWTAYPDRRQYPNRDGFAIERGYENGIIRRGLIENVADAAIDIKGKNWTVDDVVAKNSLATIKAWCSNTFGRIASHDPRNAHVWACGDVSRAERARIVIRRLEAHGDPTRPLVIIKQGPRPPMDVVIDGTWNSDQVLYKVEGKAAGSTVTINGVRKTIG